MEDEATAIDAVKKIDKFQASIDRKTAGSEKHPYKPEPGERWVPEINHFGDEPTYQRYLQRLREGNGEVADDSEWGKHRYGLSWDEQQALEENEEV